jgi:hypothetical protein
MLKLGDYQTPQTTPMPPDNRIPVCLPAIAGDTKIQEQKRAKLSNVTLTLRFDIIMILPKTSQDT